jgi:hypothetical protein
MKTNMLLIIVLGLFAQLALVSGDCECQSPKMKNFDWYKVGIIVLMLFLKKATAKMAAWVNISLLVPLKKFEGCISDSTFE